MVAHASVFTEHRVFDVGRLRVQKLFKIFVQNDTVAPRWTPRFHVLVGMAQILTKRITLHIKK